MAALPRFVVQLHDATALHYDLRLQVGEVMRSWAVPRGPSLDPAVRRLAMQVADHSLASGDFEGVHEGHLRGSGAVIIWDEGTADLVRDDPEHLSFALNGHKLTGGFGLTRTGERRWILVKAATTSHVPGPTSTGAARQRAQPRPGRNCGISRKPASPEEPAELRPGQHAQRSVCVPIRSLQSH